KSATGRQTVSREICNRCFARSAYASGTRRDRRVNAGRAALCKSSRDRSLACCQVEIVRCSHAVTVNRLGEVAANITQVISAQHQTRFDLMLNADVELLAVGSVILR